MEAFIGLANFLLAFYTPRESFCRFWIEHKRGDLSYRLGEDKKSQHDSRGV